MRQPKSRAQSPPPNQVDTVQFAFEVNDEIGQLTPDRQLLAIREVLLPELDRILDAASKHSKDIRVAELNLELGAFDAPVSWEAIKARFAQTLESALAPYLQPHDRAGHVRRDSQAIHHFQPDEPARKSDKSAVTTFNLPNERNELAANRRQLALQLRNLSAAHDHQHQQAALLALLPLLPSSAIQILATSLGLTPRPSDPTEQARWVQRVTLKLERDRVGTLNSVFRALPPQIRQRFTHDNQLSPWPSGADGQTRWVQKVTRKFKSQTKDTAAPEANFAGMTALQAAFDDITRLAGVAPIGRDRLTDIIRRLSGDAQRLPDTPSRSITTNLPHWPSQKHWSSKDAAQAIADLPTMSATDLAALIDRLRGPANDPLRAALAKLATLANPAAAYRLVALSLLRGTSVDIVAARRAGAETSGVATELAPQPPDRIISALQSVLSAAAKTPQDVTAKRPQHTVAARLEHDQKEGDDAPDQPFAGHDSDAPIPQERQNDRPRTRSVTSQNGMVSTGPVGNDDQAKDAVSSTKGSSRFTNDPPITTSATPTNEDHAKPVAPPASAVTSTPDTGNSAQDIAIGKTPGSHIDDGKLRPAPKIPKQITAPSRGAEPANKPHTATHGPQAVDQRDDLSPSHQPQTDAEILPDGAVNATQHPVVKPSGTRQTSIKNGDQASFHQGDKKASTRVIERVSGQSPGASRMQEPTVSMTPDAELSGNNRAASHRRSPNDPSRVDQPQTDAQYPATTQANSPPQISQDNRDQAPLDQGHAASIRPESDREGSIGHSDPSPKRSDTSSFAPDPGIQAAAEREQATRRTADRVTDKKPAPNHEAHGHVTNKADLDLSTATGKTAPDPSHPATIAQGHAQAATPTRADPRPETSDGPTEMTLPTNPTNDQIDRPTTNDTTHEPQAGQTTDAPVGTTGADADTADQTMRKGREATQDDQTQPSGISVGLAGAQSLDDSDQQRMLADVLDASMPVLASAPTARHAFELLWALLRTDTAIQSDANFWIAAFGVALRGDGSSFDQSVQAFVRALTSDEPDPLILRGMIARLGYGSQHDAPLRQRTRDALEGLITRHTPKPLTKPIVAPAQVMRIETQVAGLVLFHPFMTLLFERMGIEKDKRGILPSHLGRAAGALGGLLRTDAPDDHPLDTLELCLLGHIHDTPMPKRDPLSPSDLQLIDGLIQSVIARWGRLGSTSPDGLRDTFVTRRGLIDNSDPQTDVLTVSKGPFDMLLDGLPWAINLVALPWMSKPLAVKWRDNDD